MSAATWSRRRLVTHLAVSCAALALPPVWAQPRPEKPPLSIAVGGVSSFYHLPLTLADQLGFFKAEGLEVELTDYVSGARAMQAVVGGAADVASGAFEHVIGLQARGQFYQAFVMQNRTPQISLGVSQKNLPGYKSFADLRGKVIGVSAPGASTHMVGQLMLARAGLRAVDVNFTGVGTGVGALAALRSGQIDAMANVDPVMTMLEQKGELRIIAETRSLKGAQAVFGGNMPASCLYASQEFIQKNPGTCQALVNALVRALQWMRTAGGRDILKAVPEPYLMGDHALYLSAFDRLRESFSQDGLMPEDGPRTALLTLAGFDSTIRAEKIDLARLYSNEFSKKAKLRFRA